jgi:diguanylate cyclase (GGDEF)-like protein
VIEALLRCLDAPAAIPRSAGERDLRFLQAIAGQLATAIGRAELFSRMAALALKDELTGAANRRGFDERLEASVGAARASGRELALVLCDVDHLKLLNDAGGHEAGDAALRRAAGVLQDLAAPLPRALVARLGGDELGVLLEDAGAATARELAEAALERLGAGDEKLGLSCGIASLELGAESPADLLRAADAALYLAKRGGRGRVCVAADNPRDAWREAAPDRRGRRALRDAAPERVDVAELLAGVVSLLDGPLATSSVGERLEALLGACATAVDATAGAVSLQAPGDPELLTLITVDRRTGHTARSGDGTEDERYAVADFPATARLLEHGGSALWRAGDEATDAGERALLEEWAMDAVLAVSARDDEGSWLLEVFADGATADLALLEPAARALALHCLYGGVPSDLSRSRAISAAARPDTLAWR